MSEEEVKNIKDLRCKLAKQITERRNAETKLALVKNEQAAAEYKLEQALCRTKELENRQKNDKKCRS